MVRCIGAKVSVNVLFSTSWSNCQPATATLLMPLRGTDSIMLSLDANREVRTVFCSKTTLPVANPPNRDPWRVSHSLPPVQLFKI